MALPESTINTVLRKDYLPKFPMLWDKQDYALAKKFKDAAQHTPSNRFTIDVDYTSISNAAWIGVNDQITTAWTEYATQGEQVKRLYLSPIRFRHDELISMNTKADVKRIMSHKTQNCLVGMMTSWTQHILTASAATQASEQLRMYDIIDATSTALHGITPSDLPDATVWQAQVIDADDRGANDRDALLNEGTQTYLPTMIRDLIAKCKRHGQKKDMVVYMPSFLFSLLCEINDSKGQGRIEREDMLRLGISAAYIDGVPCVEDPWMSYGQTTDQDGKIYLINHEYTKMYVNKNAMFTTSGLIPGQTNTSKIAHVSLYANFGCHKRCANGVIKDIFSDADYN